MSGPPFVMSMYANKEALLEAKAIYYMELADKWQEILSIALQADLEHGVAWMNDEAAAEFNKKYPLLNAALGRIQDEEIGDG